MKKINLAVKTSLLALASMIYANAAEKEKPAATEFLFIGNSFTYYNELKDVFEELAEEGNPGKDFNTEQIIYGGRSMFHHFELFQSQNLLRFQKLTDTDLQRSIEEMNALAKSTEPTFFTEYWENMDSSNPKPWQEPEAASSEPSPAQENQPAPKPERWAGDQDVFKQVISNHRQWIANRAKYPAAWDYLVLQSWQDMQANPETGFLKYASKFSELAQQQNTKVILYITAPYSQNKDPVTEPVQKEQALAEVHLAAKLAEKTGAIVVPVPLAIYLLQKNGTTLPLRYQKDFHLNPYCTYLTACLFYAAIFEKSPEGLTLSHAGKEKIDDSTKKLATDHDGNPTKREFTDEERTLMQRTAWEAMKAFRSGDF